DDILLYIKNKKNQGDTNLDDTVLQEKMQQPVVQNFTANTMQPPTSINGGDEIIEMDRMRKLISGYMVASLQTSAHVQSFIEVDVTNMVKWRDKVKNAFEKREGEKLTFTPLFMEVIAKSLKDFPMMNISVDGEYIIKKKNINLGMAAALANGNLIVPVIKNADLLNLVGMAKAVNDLAHRARTGRLKPDDTQGGTYTVTNVGTFGSVFGTPIINQPQVGILALGAIRKVPAVIETPEGDFIGIRQKMFLSHSYDHRVIDGALGGNFVKRVAEYLEAWDIHREI
ncbi:MAG TPA: diapophytoene dehydrogenase, partial [Flavobacterium sp.]|nr:diapophytoene dehydrogenase [Flavobacterium sp.]